MKYIGYLLMIIGIIKFLPNLLLIGVTLITIIGAIILEIWKPFVISFGISLLIVILIHLDKKFSINKKEEIETRKRRDEIQKRIKEIELQKKTE